METWDPPAKWAEKFGGWCTSKGRELKLDLMSLVVEQKSDGFPQPDKHQIVRPETISPPPERWIHSQIQRRVQ